MSTQSLLFDPLTIRSVTLPNRIVVSPLCMYSARHGVAQDWHFAHLSTFARGKSGLVFAEATAVEARGRITPQCLGLWNEEQVSALKPITAFIESMGCVPGIQLAHAGRKASCNPPFKGGKPLQVGDDDAPWTVVGPSASPVATGWPTPNELSISEIEQTVEQFGLAAQRALRAGFKVVEIHAAHGYLIHSYLSPLSNHRTDAYGGSLEGRMRFALQVTDAVRANWPEDLPLFCRISAIDSPGQGWSIDDSVELSRALAKRGVDVVDCSSGGIKGAPSFRSDDAGKPLTKSSARERGFQVPYAERVRKEAGLKSMAVGVIVDADQAEDILQQGRADLIGLGREIMYNPFWPLHAAQHLGADADFKMWPRQYGWAVDRRAQIAMQNQSASVRN